MPVAVGTAEGWQHSQTRLSMETSGPTLASRETVVYIMATSPALPAAAAFFLLNFRLSNQMTPTPPPGAGSSETKPCSTGLRSRCGITGLLQVRPASREKAMLTLYPSLCGTKVVQ